MYQFTLLKEKNSILPCFKVWLCAWSLTASAWALLQTLAIRKLLVINYLWLKLVASNRNQFCRRLQLIAWIYLTVLSDSCPYLGHEGSRKLCVCFFKSILPKINMLFLWKLFDPIIMQTNIKKKQLFWLDNLFGSLVALIILLDDVHSCGSPRIVELYKDGIKP